MLWPTELKRHKFLSTPSARRATFPFAPPHPGGDNFYPRPPRGGRPMWMLRMPLTPYFYPRPPRGGRPMQTHVHINAAGFLSTPSARRATEKGGRPMAGEIEFLSTPSARRATRYGMAADWRMVFLSTPSARRATAKTETKSLFSNKLYNILHEFRRALIYNGSKSYPNHAK